MTADVTTNVATGATTGPHPAVAPFEPEKAGIATISADGDKETKGERAARKHSKGRTFVLTARDADVVRWVYDARVTTREHVQRLFFTAGGRTRCHTRLSLLLQNRYLDRLEGRPANWPDVFVVSRSAFRGARLLRASGFDEPLDFQGVAPERLQHTLDIVSCRVQFLVAGQSPGMNLGLWRGEAELAPAMMNFGIVPDAYVQLARATTEGEKRIAFFVEVERSDKSERLLREKFQRYGALYYGGEYERLFGTKALRVLVLIGSSYGIVPERRCEKFAALAAELQVTFLRFAPLERFIGLPAADVLAAPIWHSPAASHLVALTPQEA